MPQEPRGQILNTNAEIFQAYIVTHPHIDFIFRIDRLSTETWRLLGLAQAKCEQISGVPLLPEIAEKLHTIFLAKGVLATTAIEGNTLTEDEVLRLMAKQLRLPPSKQYLADEVTNILEAVNQIAPHFLNDSAVEITPENIKTYNAMVLKGLPLDDEVIPGEFRHHDVWVGGYKGAPAENVRWLVGQLCDKLNQWRAPEERQDLKFAYSVLKAILAHVYIAWIHPFADGNGRTARLMEFGILLAAGVPTPAAHLLSNYYNETRSEYYRHLQISSSAERGGIYAFVDYALKGFVENLDAQIQHIEQQQLNVHWKSYIYDQFRGHKDGKTTARRRQLIFDMSAAKQALSFEEIRHLSPKIAEAYAGKTDRTIQRDLNALARMGLIVIAGRKYSPNQQIIQAFLPLKRNQ
ncbi:MAG: Fic family protein [Chloroflexota bacterium]